MKTIKTMKKVIGVLSVVALMGVSSVTSAQVGNTGDRTIEQISCVPGGAAPEGSICTVIIDLAGGSVGPAACVSRQIVFDLADSPNGKAVYAMMLSAFVSGNPVSFFISPNCLDDRPTFTNARIEQAS